MFLVSDILDSYFSLRLQSAAYRKEVFQQALDKKLRNSKVGLVLVRNMNKAMTKNSVYQNEFIGLLEGKNYQKSFWESDLGYGWYFWNPPSENKYFQIVLKDMNTYNHTSLLDVGCGWGGLSAMASELPFVKRVLGIDIGEEIIDAAQNRYPDSKAKFICIDAKQVQEKFDVVAMMGSTDYIPPQEFSSLLDHLLSIANKEIIIQNSLRKVDFNQYLQLKEAKEVRRYDVGFVQPIQTVLLKLQGKHKFRFEINRAGEDSVIAKIFLGN